MPKPYRKNPRKITQKQLENLESTLAELGDLSGIVHDLNTDEIVGGNQRSKVFRLEECEIVLTEEYAQPDEQGTVGLGFVVWRGKRYAYRAVRWDERTAERANIVANRAGGSWDFEMLATEFAMPDLVAWGFEPVDFGLSDEGDTDEDAEEVENYSRNIEPPIYKPTGERPEITDLFDDTKTKKLIDAINHSEDIDEYNREFLIMAAHRHTIFDFGKIAEYYAHASPEMQLLMESNALVIIDFDKAIENGFVKLSKIIMELAGNDGY